MRTAEEWDIEDVKRRVECRARGRGLIPAIRAIRLQLFRDIQAEARNAALEEAAEICDAQFQTRNAEAARYRAEGDYETSEHWAHSAFSVQSCARVIRAAKGE